MSVDDDQPPDPGGPSTWSPPPESPAHAQAASGLPAYGQQSDGAPPYGAPAYGQYGQSRPRHTNGFAIASLVLGILGILGDFLFGVGIVGSVLALIFGYVGRSQIRERGDSGGGMAIAGIVLGWIAVALFILFILLFVVVGITLTSKSGGFAT
jgi:hypothetical protein